MLHGISLAEQYVSEDFIGCIACSTRFHWLCRIYYKISPAAQNGFQKFYWMYKKFPRFHWPYKKADMISLAIQNVCQDFTFFFRFFLNFFLSPDFHENWRSGTSTRLFTEVKQHWVLLLLFHDFLC